MHHLPDPYLTSIRTRLIRLMIMDEYINYYLNKPEGQVSDGEDKAMELFPKKQTLSLSFFRRVKA